MQHTLHVALTITLLLFGYFLADLCLLLIDCTLFACGLLRATVRAAERMGKWSPWTDYVRAFIYFFTDRFLHPDKVDVVRFKNGDVWKPYWDYLESAKK